MDENAAVQICDGYSAVVRSLLGRTTLSWYDKYTLTSFRAESNLSAEELARAFSEMDARLPEYVPTWIPEGFELVDEYRDGGSTAFVYLNTETEAVVLLEYYDRATIDSITGFLSDSDVIKEIEINGLKAVLGFTDSSGADYDPDSINNGTVLIWEDPEINIIFKIDGEISPEDAIKIAEGITSNINIQDNN